MIIGVDIGGTKIRAALVTDNGKIKKKVVMPTQTDKPKETTIKNIINAIDQVFVKPVKGIGVGTAGHTYKGIIYKSPNIPSFRKINLKKILEEKFKVRVEIDNDANCFAMREARFGKGKNKKIVVGSIHGTGFGCGIVINKKLVSGRNNCAGGFGMIRIPGGPRGVLEDFCSGRFISLRAKANGLKTTNPSEVSKLALKGDKKAQKTYEEFAEKVALACSIITCTLNPDIIILGGGTIKEQKAFEKYIRKYYKQFIVYPTTADTKIVFSKLKDSGILGAAGLIKE